MNIRPLARIMLSHTISTRNRSRLNQPGQFRIVDFNQFIVGFNPSVYIEVGTVGKVMPLFSPMPPDSDTPL